MKKILLILILLLFLIGCDNNEGPFEVIKEEGVTRLYSDGKYAKGLVNNYGYDYMGNKVLVSTVEYNQGLPTGNFTIYNLEGKELFKFQGKIDKEIFKGKIIYPSGRITEGKMGIYIDAIINYQGEWVPIVSKYIDTVDYSGRTIEKYKNDFLYEKYTYYDKELKNLKTKIIYKEENRYPEKIKYAEEYYESGKLFRKYTLNSAPSSDGGEFYSMFVEEFYEDGTKLSEGLFQQYIFEYLHREGIENLNMNEIPTKYFFGQAAINFSKIPSLDINIALKCFKNDGITLLRTFDLIDFKYIDIKFYEDGGVQYRKEYDIAGNIKGVHKYYYKTGELLKEEYKDRKYRVNAEKEYYKNGKLKREIYYYTHRNEPSKYIEYYENGKIKKRWDDLDYRKKENAVYLYDETGKLVKKDFALSMTLQELEDLKISNK